MPHQHSIEEREMQCAAKHIVIKFKYEINEININENFNISLQKYFFSNDTYIFHN